ncbi:MAG: penicillin-binding transpeptidase domain-containing protein, partial [Chloroflexota bacterium]|nr:penicillin-binding transpeptidase domain-containing protein [Chloroflexota bacterium]
MIFRQSFPFNKGFLILIMMFGALSACVPDSIIRSTSPAGSSDISGAAAAQLVMTQFLFAWQERDYAEMYGLISTLSQDAISLEAFKEEYQEAAKNLSQESLDFQVLSTMAESNHSEVAFRVDFSTHLIGDLTRNYIAGLTFESGNWWIQWERRLILPELKDGSALLFVHQTPSRGRIFAQDGEPLAAYEDAIALGIVPGEILPQQAELVYATLAELSVYEPEGLQALVESTPTDWYLPVVTLSQSDVMPYMDTLRDLQGVRIGEFRSRFYVDGGVAPHAVGYMLYIPEEDLDIYLEQGYSKDERVGAAGLEKVFEKELSGTRGGVLYVVDQDGKIQSLLTASDPVPGQSLYATINKPLQMRLQASLGDLRAAVVVIEVDTGRVLALVSNPDFDPNAFDLAETDRSLLDSYFNDENEPLFNRATQGQYPLGSVFKTITMSTALETGLYHAASSFNCGHSLWVCDSVTLYDWTYAHGTASSGELTLPEGLMRSCNPWFYRIGENLFTEGLEDALSDMAYDFGLGAETGIEILEASGYIPDTAGTCVNNTQMAIGQGEILVTPLQVTAYYAAIANGGT